uniref:G-protein coupled receptors family 2 profile 2 domain-containing protein n=1 Tax=Terrapene triunguis TaxID=2587831 RepID=A0A674IV60_9SAUR
GLHVPAVHREHHQVAGPRGRQLQLHPAQCRAPRVRVRSGFISYFRYMTLVNIALSLLMANAWFLGSTWMTPSHENELCVAATFFTHFFYLAMFFWMLVQALLLFHHLVFVFHQLARASIMPLMVTLGYLCPLLIAAATVAVYYPKRGYVQATACWLNGHNGAIYAFSVPVLVIVLVNVLILFVVVMKLMRPSLSEGPKGEERKTLLSILKALLILTPIFGLTWGLGIITMTSKSSELSHYMFAVLNSFQVGYTTWQSATCARLEMPIISFQLCGAHIRTQGLGSSPPWLPPLR